MQSIQLVIYNVHNVSKIVIYDVRGCSKSSKIVVYDVAVASYFPLDYLLHLLLCTFTHFIIHGNIYTYTHIHRYTYAPTYIYIHMHTYTYTHKHAVDAISNI